ncbi:Rpn family recombination-promoting nuclease/putative transposase [Trichothermofontia sp.]
MRSPNPTVYQKAKRVYPRIPLPSSEIDGVFLPPQGEQPGIICFCEAQFQKDDRLYERLFSESCLFFYQNRDRFSDWYAIVIYPSRSTEQTDRAPYQVLLDSHHVHRIYLDELGPPADLPIGLALMVLTILKETQAPATARSRSVSTGESLMARVEQELPALLSDTRGIMEWITTMTPRKIPIRRSQATLSHLRGSRDGYPTRFNSSFKTLC